MRRIISCYDEYMALLRNADNKQRKIIIFYYYEGEDDCKTVEEEVLKMTHGTHIVLHLFECRAILEGNCFANFKSYPVLQFVHGVETLAHAEGGHLENIQTLVTRLRDQ
ncbi:hypothetical protein EMPS_09148 [Entomortierella parvispora]|uniref:Thioredoxin n=1 Tax=Entomortierella parvispora TaxID=205924 RepID=A0A9P3HHF4_9FUNG|nr:hypothetical protein EMPS_09148 [Entomortierella parvispora]